MCALLLVSIWLVLHVVAAYLDEYEELSLIRIDSLFLNILPEYWSYLDSFCASFSGEVYHHRT